MPIYDYQCQKCKKVSEVFLTREEAIDHEEICCGEPMVKILGKVNNGMRVMKGDKRFYKFFDETKTERNARLGKLKPMYSK
jgi:putative FmdB family regulatory protein